MLSSITAKLIPKIIIKKAMGYDPGGEEKTPRCSGGLNPVSLQPSGAVDGVVPSWPGRGTVLVPL